MNNTTDKSAKSKLTVNQDHQRIARLVHLSYVQDMKDGVKRFKKGDHYTYQYKNKTIRDKKELERIKKLAIPPSWSDVWICPSTSGHIQATGTDLLGRKQYRYHAKWSEIRNETKFHRLQEFGKVLPRLRKKIQHDLKERELTANKVVAASIRMMEQTSIRVGNNGYEKLYGSYGLTTLKDKHVSIQNDEAHFSFIGKKGIEHKITLKNKKLAGIIKQCRDIPGKELFQYYQPDGSRKTIDSGMVNNYIKEATQGDFSAKDFRTWSGSVQALQCFCTAKKEASETSKKSVPLILDEVSARLGNTRNVCKKYYVHPLLIRLYEENKLPDCSEESNNGEAALNSNEKLLMKILKQEKN